MSMNHFSHGSIVVGTFWPWPWLLFLGYRFAKAASPPSPLQPLQVELQEPDRLERLRYHPFALRLRLGRNAAHLV